MYLTVSVATGVAISHRRCGQVVVWWLPEAASAIDLGSRAGVL